MLPLNSSLHALFKLIISAQLIEKCLWSWCWCILGIIKPPDKTTFVDRNIQGGSRLVKVRIFLVFIAGEGSSNRFLPSKWWSNGQDDISHEQIIPSIHPQSFTPPSVVHLENDCFAALSFLIGCCCAPQSQLRCALWKLLLIRTQKAPLLLNLMDDPLVGMWDCPSSPLWFKKVLFLEGGTRCDWSIYDKTGMWWHRECGWQWRMTEQITVYRLQSGPLSCDASLYCAAVKRFIHHRVALLYRLIFLIWQSAEQRPCQQSPSRHVGKTENALWRETEGVWLNIVASKETSKDLVTVQTGTTTSIRIFH